MPTGYTQYILDGADFKTYAKVCARAFGAMVTERDNPLSPELPEKIEPSDYHDKKLVEAQQYLERLNQMTEEGKEKGANKEYEEELASYKKCIETARQTKLKLEIVLEEVEKWQPPTSEHTRIKEFMREQIISTINFDGSDIGYEEPKKLSGIEWHKNQVSKAIKDIAYHTEKGLEEKQRAKERTEWIQAYLKSLS